MPGHNSGRNCFRTRAIEPRYRPPGQQWILGEGLRGGDPGKPPCWRTLEESCKGLGSVSLKINTQRTHALLPEESRNGLGSVTLKINNPHTL